jgi:hypothetical protein
LLTRMARSACALTACEPVVKLTWRELTSACSPSRGTDGLCALGPLRGPPGEGGCPARTRPGQRTGSTGRTPGSSPDWRGVSCSSGSSNGSRRTRSQKAGGRSGPVSKGRQWPDPAVRGPPARSDSEAKSNQKSRHATEAEAAWAPSDQQGQGSMAPESLGPNAGQFLPEPPRRLIRCMPLHFFLSLTRQGSSLRLHLPLR